MLLLVSEMCSVARFQLRLRRPFSGQRFSAFSKHVARGKYAFVDGNDSVGSSDNVSGMLLALDLVYLTFSCYRSTRQALSSSTPCRRHSLKSSVPWSRWHSPFAEDFVLDSVSSVARRVSSCGKVRRTCLNT